MSNREALAGVLEQESVRRVPSKNDRFFDANEDFSADCAETPPDAWCAAAPGITADRAMLHTVQQQARMDTPSATHSPSVGLAMANASVRMRLDTNHLPSSGAAPLTSPVLSVRPKQYQHWMGPDTGEAEKREWVSPLHVRPHQRVTIARLGD